MKRGLILLTAAVFLFSFTACGAETDTRQTANVISAYSDAETEYTEGQTQPDTEQEGFELPVGSSGLQTVIQETDAYIVYELSFEREGRRIYGQFYLPKTVQDKYPTVIISHGFGSSYSVTAPYAERLAEAGIAGYVFDFCGGSAGSRSDGSMLEMSVLTEKADLEAVFNGLSDFDFVDDGYMFLMGESQGGLVSALVAADHMEDVQGLVLLYPAFVIPDNARAQYSDVFEIPEETSALGMRVGKRYYADVLDMDVYEEIQGYMKDVLLIHGSSDNLVPIDYSRRAAEVYESAELITLEGSGHGFYGSSLEEAAQAATEFVLAHCGNMDSSQGTETLPSEN